MTYRSISTPLAACAALLLMAPLGEATERDRACKPVACSTLLPATLLDDTQTRDCGYTSGNQWWLDYVAGSLAWNSDTPRRPVVVALFDDGVDSHHVDLRNQLWVNEAEAVGKRGVDDDGNGYIDDINGWDFVDDDAQVFPEGECRLRQSHGTFMASLIAAERNNDAGIVAAGSDGARVMALRIVGCGRGNNDRLNPERLLKALDYASAMGAKILSFSAHWEATTPELDAAFAQIANEPQSERAAIVVASVPNKGKLKPGYPAAYPFQRIIRAIPIGNDDMISPGTTWTPPGLNIGAPSACIMGATAAPDGYAVRHGSSNSTAILAGLLAGIWSSPSYAGLTTDEFLTSVVQERMLRTARRSLPGSWSSYAGGVPLAHGCMLATEQQSARICSATRAR